MKVDVATKTSPEAIPVKEAAKIANRDTSQIHNAIATDDLDHGYAFEYEINEEAGPTLGERYESRGQKLIIKNHKWARWLRQRRMYDKEKEERLRKKAYKEAEEEILAYNERQSE